MAAERDDRLRHGRSFGAVAAAYAQLRPGYPAEILDFLLGKQFRRVLDLGAGTGKLSEVLLAAGYEVLAVDPSAEMLAELAGRWPTVQAVVGIAEAIPLSESCVDAVVAGQAAHWFDLPVAATEIDRVLQPGGALGLVWNLGDERVAWVAALGELLKAADNHTSAEEDRIAALLAESLSRKVQQAEFSYIQELTPEQLLASLATRSQVVLLEAGARDQLLAAAGQLIASHPETRDRPILELPYRCLAYKFTG